MSALISVIVVAYNSADDLAELLPLLKDPRLEVLVLDNNSPDSGRAVVAQHPWCTSIEMGFNAGWSAASNEGARRATGKVYAFVNPDVRVLPDQLERLSEFLGPGVASVSPSFIDLDGRPYEFAFRFPEAVTGLFVFFNAGQRIDRLMGSRFNRRRTYADLPKRPADVDHVGAACLVVEAATFSASGGFDERMWLFFSDTDWALRLRQRHELSIRIDDVRVVHEGGGSVGHQPVRDLATSLQRDYLVYANKHYSWLGRAVTIFGVVLLVGFLPALAALLRRDRRAFSACLAQVRVVIR